jgi:arylsulfatase A-like enzyme
MTRRQCLAGMAAASTARAARKPNIILIVADDLGYNDLGFQGSPEILSPHIDSLVRDGTRFPNGYVSHPFCSPTRAGMMTGRYQQRFGHENNMVFSRDDAVAGLPLTERMLPEILSRAGYATGLVGKWHLGAHDKFHPTRRGFREMYGFVGGGHDYFKSGPVGEKEQILIPIERQDRKPVDEREYLTTALGREAEAFVRRHKEEPFFLYLAFNAPHTPLQAPDDYIARFRHIADPNRRTYAAMVAAMDDSVGRVLGAVRESGLDNDTLVVFLSDNGGPAGNGSNNAPLRGTKRTLWEGGIRVPFAVRWKGRVAPGRVDQRLAISLDVFTTALAAAGLKPPADREIDGMDLLSPPPRSRRLYWRTFGGEDLAVREGRLKLLRQGKAAAKLFDLEDDPGEARDLAIQRPADVKRLSTALDAWNRTLAKPLWLDHFFHRDQLSRR